jgi:hypothetical protein
MLWLAAFVFLTHRASSQPIPSDPVCGFLSGPHFYYENDQIIRGLTVDLACGDATAGQPIILRFLVTEKPRNTPVDQLQVEHEKLMHIIGVRDDLQEFFHIHPIKTGPGTWEVPHRFEKGGRYKIWSDQKYRGVSYSIGHPILSVSGNIGASRRDLNGEETNSNVMVSGYRVALQSKLRPALPGTNQFEFLITDRAGRMVRLENYLGAAMHLVIVRSDLAVYVHAHPEASRSADGSVIFRPQLDKPGRYKLFAQFRPSDAGLAGEDALLAEFWFTVSAPKTEELSD